MGGGTGAPQLRWGRLGSSDGTAVQGDAFASGVLGHPTAGQSELRVKPAFYSKANFSAQNALRWEQRLLQGPILAPAALSVKPVWLGVGHPGAGGPGGCVGKLIQAQVPERVPWGSAPQGQALHPPGQGPPWPEAVCGPLGVPIPAAHAEPGPGRSGLHLSGGCGCVRGIGNWCWPCPQSGAAGCQCVPLLLHRAGGFSQIWGEMGRFLCPVPLFPPLPSWVCGAGLLLLNRAAAPGLFGPGCAARS